LETARDTIYIVDDDEGVRDSARALLESYDMVVEDFASAREFLASFDEAVAGLVLLDVNMPEMTGLELLEHMRAQSIATPVIFVTAQHDAQMRARATRAGAFAMLEKPVDDRLITTINDALKSAA
jgi:FixJ family two-component response regulator